MIPAINGTDFDERRSVDRFDRHFSHDFSETDSFHVIVGSDSGLLLDWFDSLVIGKGSKIVLIEPDRWHAPIAARDPQPRMSTTIRLATASSWEDMLDDSHLYEYVYGGKLILSESIACTADRTGEYRSLHERVNSRLSARSRDLKAHVNTRQFVECQLQNVLDNVTPASVLRGQGRGSVAIVLGGGPSLDTHLPWIIAHRDELTVFAASRLCARLDAEGVRPDAVVSVDPQDGMFDLSKAGVRWEDTLLVNGYHVAPALLAQWRGPTAYLGPSVPWSTTRETPADIVALRGPTVSHAATWLAFECGFDEILLSGVDLCFSAAGSTHATGSIEDKIGALATAADSQVDTYSGATATSTYALKSSIDALARCAGDIRARGAAVYNLSAEAAVVEHIEWRDPASLTLRGRQVSLEVPGQACTRPGHLRAVADELRQARAGLVQIARLCKRGIDHVDRLHGFGGAPADYRYKHKLDKLEDELSTRFPDHVALAKNLANAEMARMMRPSGFDEMDEREFADWGKQYYRALGKSATQLRKRIDAMQRRVEQRRLEWADEPDVDALIEHWHHESTPGRAWHVLHRADDRLDAESHARLSRYLAEFDDSLCREDSAYAQLIDAGTRDIPPLLTAMTFLFTEQRTVELDSLATRLQSGDGIPAIVGQLGTGMLDELNARPDEAYLRYEHALDAISDQLHGDGGVSDDLARVLEAVLLRITHTRLAQHDVVAAIESLGVLAQHAISFAPMYARLLSLNGLLDEAIEVLDIYRDACPGDWRTLDTLADLYRRQGNETALRETLALAARHRPERAYKAGDPAADAHAA